MNSPTVKAGSRDAHPPSSPADHRADAAEIFLPVTDLPPNFIDRWILAVPRNTVRLRLVFRDGRLLIAVGGLPRTRHEELERWLACRKREIFCG